MFLIRFFFVVISSSIFAQQTNIEQLPRPKIDDENLKTLSLNDGTPIFTMVDTSEIFPWIINPFDSHKPALYKLDNNDVIYNYYAIQNTKLCPIGKHVINVNDIQLTDNIEKSRLSFYKSSVFIDYTGDCQTGHETKIIKDKIIAVETKKTIKNIDGSKFLSVLFLSDGNYTEINNETSDFLPTRCVEDLTYSFQNNVYSYASLMPQKFNQLKQRLAQEALFRSQNTNLNEIQGIFNVGFNHSGENVSTLSSNQNQDFWNSLMPIVKNKQHLPSPYYESIFLSTKDAITVKLLEIDDYAKMEKGKKEAFHYKTYFKSPGDEINFSKLNDAWIKNRYSTNRYGNVTNLDQFFNYTATVKVEPFKYQVAVDNTLQKTPTYFVNKFHLSGSLTPLKSLVFPGLGSKTLRFDKASKTHKALAITSLVLSAISFSVSEVLYQDYRRNINAEPFSMKYDIANSLHKVGLVSLGIYPVISISDILSCYIKCKNDGIQLAGNKRIQRQVNKEINDNRRKNIYLCRD